MDNIEATHEEDGMSVTDILQPYSEEERQENLINKENAEAIFSPEFIPFYTDIKKEFGLSYAETIIYGFIRYYMWLKKVKGRFYFTNQHIAEMLDCSSNLVNIAINKLSQLKLIEKSHKIKAGGGTIRFVTKVRTSETLYYEYQKSDTHSIRNLIANNNKINKNKINNNIYTSDKETKPERKVKENKENTDVERIFTLYKQKIASGARLTPEGRKKIIARLEGFSAEELEKAINNFGGDKWWMENCSWRGIRWFFHNEDRILQFINMPKRSQDYGTTNPNLTLEEKKALDEKYKRFD